VYNIKIKLIRISRFLGWFIFSIFKRKTIGLRVHSKKGMHWFIGYYDVRSIRNNQLYFHEVSVMPKNDTQKCKIMSLNLKTNKVRELYSSYAVNWQLGSRLQLYGDDLAFNDCVNGKLIHRVINLNNKVEIFCDVPFWSKNIEMDFTFTIDFERLWSERRGYGYYGKMASELKDAIGILDYNCKNTLSIIKLERIQKELRLPQGGYLNHIVMNDNCSLILTTYNFENKYKRFVQPVIYDLIADKIYTFNPGATFSHPAFIGTNKIGYFDGSGYVHFDLNTKNRFYYFKTKSDGHPTFLPNGNLITDTYPNKYSKMEVYEFSSGKKIEHLKHFNPPPFHGDNRCDLHPRYENELLLMDLPFLGGRAIGSKKLVLQN